jgi:hypothetical protein
MVEHNSKKCQRFLGGNLKLSSIVFLCSLAAIYILAWLLLQKIIFSWDVSWLLEASKRMLAGGTYAKDFFENNPPLILYLYMPPVLASLWLPISVMAALKLYVYLLISIMLVTCQFFLKSIFSDDVLLRRVFLVVLCAVALLFPMYEFGQREHLLLIFIMPYLLLLCYRLQGQNVDPMVGLGVGVFAGLGFALKPVFLVTWILLESYYLISKKSIFSLIRSETIAIVALVMVYLAMVFWLHPDYLQIVVPFSLRWCYSTDWLPWRWVLMYPFLGFLGFVLLLYGIQYRHSRHKIAITILALTFVGFIFSYTIQRTYWYYHFLPALSLGVLLSTVLFYEYTARPVLSRSQSGWLSFYIVSLLVYEINFMPSLSTFLFFQPIICGGFFSGLFALLLLFLYRKDNLTWKSITKITCLSSIACLVCIYSLTIIGSIDWYANRFSLMILLAVVFFGLIAPERLTFTTRIRIFVLGVGLFLYPYYLVCTVFLNHQLTGLDAELLVDSLQKYKNVKSVYFLSTEIKFVSVVLNYGLPHAKSVSRFSHFWMLAGLLSEYDNKHSQAYKAQDRNFFLDMVAEDIQQKQPELVFVDTREQKNKLWTYIEGAKKKAVYWNFDYIQRFSENQHFQAAWKHYHYVQTITIKNELISYPLYQFAVYQRNP